MSKMRANPARFINQAIGPIEEGRVFISGVSLVAPTARAPSVAAKLRLMARFAALAAPALIAT
jgi:hypothetical protein